MAIYKKNKQLPSAFHSDCLRHPMGLASLILSDCLRLSLIGGCLKNSKLDLRSIFLSPQSLANKFASLSGIKKPANAGFEFFSGERGIRTPGPVTVNSFQDCRNRPLCQLSAAKVRVGGFLSKTF